MKVMASTKLKNYLYGLVLKNIKLNEWAFSLYQKIPEIPVGK